MGNEHSWPLGVVLGQARLRQGVSRREMAKRAGVSDTLLQTYERGYELRRGERFSANPTPDKLHAVARAYGLNPADVFELAGLEYVTAPTVEGGDQVYEALASYIETIRKAWGPDAANAAIDRVYRDRHAESIGTSVRDGLTQSD